MRSRPLAQLLAGLLWIALVLLLAQRSEALDLLRFPLAWAGVLFALDGAVRLRHGSSPLATPGDWAWSLCASAAFWDLFELFNLRLQNWWYTAETRTAWGGALFSAISFSTVLPAVQLCLALLSPRQPSLLVQEERDRAQAEDDRAHAAPPRPHTHGLFGNAPLLICLGLAAFALAMLLPRSCFPLAWFFLWPLAEAVLLLLPPPNSPALLSPLQSWREGDRAPALRLLLCGIPIGLVWEGLNWGCARGWVYTVPHFESHKLFEMPLAGFLGYPPFFLEAGAILALIGRARGWLQQRPRPARRALLATFACALLFFHLACDGLARVRTAISLTPRLTDSARLQPLASQLEAKLGIATPRELLLARASVADARALARRASLGDEQLPQLEQALHQSELVQATGMGLLWSERLHGAGIDSLTALASADDAALSLQLEERERIAGEPAPDPMVLRLWIARARAALQR